MATNNYTKCKDCDGTGIILIKYATNPYSTKCTTCNGKGNIKIKLPIKINKKRINNG